jgi:phosphoenolpyruvate synthase/pyruvate phosphate dikinase
MWINPRPTLSKAGGKAYQLYRLKRWCNVPPFFVIAFKNPQEISDPENQQLIIEQCRNQEFELMAVRSSATCEDSPQASFAGMFETVLGARPSELIGAITEVLNSVSRERVADYCEAQGLAQNKIRMAVIVQRIINSRVSGVCFTQLQNSKPILMEACYGLGEVLVSGKVTPDTYMVDRNDLSVIRESIGYQKVRLTMRVDGEKPIYEEIPFHKRNARKLTYEEVRAIAQTCLLIEKRLAFGAADIEWAFEGDVLYILQARPYLGGT